MASNQEVRNRINAALEQIRPYLIEDGGDVELVDLSKDFVAKIELKGNCTSCSMNSMTFKNGIIDSITKAVPEVKSVEAINFKVFQPGL